MKARVMFVSLLVAASIAAYSAGQPQATIIIPVQPKPVVKPLDPFSSQGLAVTFKMDNASFETSKQISGEYAIKCVGPAGFNVYNPLYNPLTYRSGEVRIFDSKRNLVCELLKFFGGSITNKETEVMVYPGDFFGSHVSGWPHGAADFELIGPGKYSAQFVLYSNIVLGKDRIEKASANPPSGSIAEKEKEFLSGNQVIAASSLVPFEITQKQKGGNPD